MHIKFSKYTKFKNLKVLVLFFFFASNVSSQNLKIPTKFFTTYNTHLSLSVGGGLSYLGPDGVYPLIISNGIIDQDNFTFKETANWNVNLGLDIYSPNSFISFFINAEFNSQNYSIENTAGSRVDYIDNWNIEVPAYVKFRFGKTTSKSHLWLALGGGYSLPIKTKFRSSIDGNETDEDASEIELFQPITFLSGLIGYEVFIRSVNDHYSSNFRVLFYVKGNYDLNNRVDPNIMPPEDSVISQIEPLDIQFLRISLGMKFLIF